jgi:hypothetical protein
VSSKSISYERSTRAKTEYDGSIVKLKSMSWVSCITWEDEPEVKYIYESSVIPDTLNTIV